MAIKTTHYYVYIIECADNTFYTGIAVDPIKRLAQHNGISRGGPKYTKSRRPVTLRFQESHADRSSASKREYQIKQLTRDEKITLMNKNSLSAR
jgi:putative endonuclease